MLAIASRSRTGIGNGNHAGAVAELNQTRLYWRKKESIVAERSTFGRSFTLPCGEDGRHTATTRLVLAF